MFNKRVGVSPFIYVDKANVLFLLAPYSWVVRLVDYTALILWSVDR